MMSFRDPGLSSVAARSFRIPLAYSKNLRSSLAKSPPMMGRLNMPLASMRRESALKGKDANYESSQSSWPFPEASSNTNCIDERGTVNDQFRHKPVRLAGHCFELPSKDKIAHDVVIQVRGPLRQVECLRPAAVVFLASGDQIG